MLGLRGYDVIGVAATGSGKTLVYLITIIVHILKNRNKGVKGPLALVMCPTRELS